MRGTSYEVLRMMVYTTSREYLLGMVPCCVHGTMVLHTILPRGVCRYYLRYYVYHACHAYTIYTTPHIHGIMVSGDVMVWRTSSLYVHHEDDDEVVEVLEVLRTMTRSSRSSGGPEVLRSSDPSGPGTPPLRTPLRTPIPRGP